MTWLIFFFNLVIYLVFNMQSVEIESKYDGFFNDKETLRVQGFVFGQFINRNPTSYSEFHQRVTERAMQGHSKALETLSALAMRDSRFTENYQSFVVEGDQLAISKWREEFGRLQEAQKDHPGHQLGLSDENPTWVKTISYQFVHGGYVHLIINMFFLMIFGSFLESVVGSAFFLILYLGTGVVAAAVFTFVTGLSSAPLIGASGAINGLIGFFILAFWRQKVSFMYFLLPRSGYSGIVELPGWTFMILWVIGDFTSLMATVPETGGVAYSAHIGGVLGGMLLGALFLTWRKATSQGVLRH